MPTLAPWALRIAPKHCEFHVAQLQKEKRKVPDRIPDGTLASKVPCEMYTRLPSTSPQFPEIWSPGKALQEQK